MLITLVKKLMMWWFDSMIRHSFMNLPSLIDLYLLYLKSFQCSLFIIISVLGEGSLNELPQHDHSSFESKYFAWYHKIHTGHSKSSDTTTEQYEEVIAYYRAHLYTRLGLIHHICHGSETWSDIHGYKIRMLCLFIDLNEKDVDSLHLTKSWLLNIQINDGRAIVWQQNMSS
jgi:hypothetical protein